MASWLCLNIRYLFFYPLVSHHIPIKWQEIRAEFPEAIPWCRENHPGVAIILKDATPFEIR